LDRPFLVLATQNPLNKKKELPVPEAQVDRFMLKTVIDYPKMDEERMVVRQNLKGSYEKVNQVVSVEQILRAQEAVAKYG
jgi:MoxR-like ATPase